MVVSNIIFIVVKFLFAGVVCAWNFLWSMEVILAGCHCYQWLVSHSGYQMRICWVRVCAFATEFCKPCLSIIMMLIIACESAFPQQWLSSYSSWWSHQSHMDGAWQLGHRNLPLSVIGVWSLADMLASICTFVINIYIYIYCCISFLLSNV